MIKPRSCLFRGFLYSRSFLVYTSNKKALLRSGAFLFWNEDRFILIEDRYRSIVFGVFLVALRTHTEYYVVYAAWYNVPTMLTVPLEILVRAGIHHLAPAVVHHGREIAYVIEIALYLVKVVHTIAIGRKGIGRIELRIGRSGKFHRNRIGDRSITHLDLYPVLPGFAYGNGL